MTQPYLAMQELGKVVIIVGLVIVAVGFVLWTGFAPRWLGRLPGDIRVEGQRGGYYFPIVSCIIISIVLSLIISIFRR